MPLKKAFQNNFLSNGYSRPLNPEFLEELVAALWISGGFGNIIDARRLQQPCDESTKAIFALLDAFRQALFHAAVISIPEAFFDNQLRLNARVLDISQHVQALLSPHGITVGAPYGRCDISHKCIAVLFPCCHVS